MIHVPIRKSIENISFRADYEINPWMRLTEQPEELKARNQWDQLRRTIEACGTTVQIVEPDRHCMHTLHFCKKNSEKQTVQRCVARYLFYFFEIRVQILSD